MEAAFGHGSCCRFRARVCRMTLSVARSSTNWVKASNWLARGSLQRVRTLFMVNVPLPRAFSRRGCAALRMIFTLLTLRAPTPATAAILCRTSMC